MQLIASDLPLLVTPAIVLRHHHAESNNREAAQRFFDAMPLDPIAGKLFDDMLREAFPEKETTEYETLLAGVADAWAWEIMPLTFPSALLRELGGCHFEILELADYEFTVDGNGLVETEEPDEPSCALSISIDPISFHALMNACVLAKAMEIASGTAPQPPEFPSETLQFYKPG